MFAELPSTESLLNAFSHTVHSDMAEVAPLRLDAQSPQAFGIIGKTQEWNLLSRSLYLGQGKSTLLMGDEGLGKSFFLNAYFKALSTNPFSTEELAPHQGLMIRLSDLPKSAWQTWGFNQLLQEALVLWSESILKHIQVQANQHLIELDLALGSEQLSLLMQEFNTTLDANERRHRWEAFLKKALDRKQNLIQKWTSSSQEKIEFAVTQLNQGWGAVAFCVQSLLSHPPHEQDTISIIKSLAESVKQYTHNTNVPSSFTIIIDAWDMILLQSHSQQQYNLKQLHTLLKTLNAQKQTPLHFTLSTRPKGLSQQLGTSTYALFRDKHLLSPYSAEDIQALVGLTNRTDFTCASLPEAFHNLSEGRADYALNLLNAWIKQSKQMGLSELTLESFDALSLESIEDLDALLYARLQLDAIQQGVGFLKALQVVVAHLDLTPFSVEGFLLDRVMNASQGISEAQLALVLRKLYLYQMIEAVPEKELPTFSITEKIPLYRVVSRRALQGLCGFFLPKEIEAIYQSTQHTLSSLDTLNSRSDFRSSILNKQEHEAQAESLLRLLPRTFEAGELTLEKFQSVLAHLQTLPKAEVNRHTQTLFDLFSNASRLSLLEARRIEAVSFLGHLPHAEVPLALIEGIDASTGLIQQEILKSLKQWMHTAKCSHLPCDSIAPQVIHALFDKLKPPEGLPKKETAIIQSLVFDALTDWSPFDPKGVFKALRQFLQDTLSSQSENTLSVGLLRCLRKLLQPFKVQDVQCNMPWLAPIILNALQEIHLQEEALALIPYVSLENSRLQESLKRMLNQPLHLRTGWQIFQYVTTHFNDFSFLHQDVFEKIASHLEISTHREPQKHDSHRRLLKALLLHLSQVQPHWLPSHQATLADVLDESLSQTGWENSLDLLWLALKLEKNVQQGNSRQVGKWMSRLDNAPTSQMVKQLLKPLV